MSRARPRLGVRHPTVVPASVESESEIETETEEDDDEATRESHGD